MARSSGALGRCFGALCGALGRAEGDRLAKGGGAAKHPNVTALRARRFNIGIMKGPAGAADGSGALWSALGWSGPLWGALKQLGAVRYG